MHKWYEEGLFDKDFGSTAYDPMGGALAELQANGTVGVWCTSGEGIGNITQPVTCVPNLTLEEGGHGSLTSTSLVTDSTNILHHRLLRGCGNGHEVPGLYVLRGRHFVL